jgi:hypothetical protein
MVKVLYWIWYLKLNFGTDNYYIKVVGEGLKLDIIYIIINNIMQI